MEFSCRTPGSCALEHSGPGVGVDGGTTGLWLQLQHAAFLLPPPAASFLTRAMWAPRPARPSSIHFTPPWDRGSALAYYGLEGRKYPHVPSGPIRQRIPGFHIPKVWSKSEWVHGSLATFLVRGVPGGGTEQGLRAGSSLRVFLVVQADVSLSLGGIGPLMRVWELRTDQKQSSHSQLSRVQHRPMGHRSFFHNFDNVYHVTVKVSFQPNSSTCAKLSSRQIQRVNVVRLMKSLLSVH